MKEQIFDFRGFKIHLRPITPGSSIFRFFVENKGNGFVCLDDAEKEINRLHPPCEDYDESPGGPSLSP